MVDTAGLALKPTAVETTEAPVQKISAGEVAQPYEMLGRSLDKLGEGLEQLATPLAEQAGYKAVTRDADGNIQVDRVPIFGEAGKAYSRAIKVAALAEGDGAAKRADLELREQYRDNPEGYQRAAQAFRDKTVKDYTAAAGPEVATALGQAIDTTTTQTYRGLLNEKERLDLQRSENRMNAGLEDARNDLMSMSRQGVPVTDTNFKNALDKYTFLLNEKASNPRLAYSQEERTLELQKLTSDLGAQRYMYHIDQTYKQNGLQAAEQDAKDVLTNPKYDALTSEQRESFYHRAIGDARASEAIRRQDVTEARAAFSDLRARAAVGDRIEPAEIDGVSKAFIAANDPQGAAAVATAFAHKDLHDGFGQLPVADQTSQLRTIQGATQARDMVDYLVSRGATREQAAGMVANSVIESSLRPAAFNPAGGGQGAVGLFQWRGERLEGLKAFAAAQGKSINDPQLQMDYALHELGTTESVAGGLLRGAKTPEEAARIFSLSYERGEGFDTARREQVARSIFDGKSADGSGGPGVASWLIANRAATLKTSATKEFDSIKEDWDNGKGIPAKSRLFDVIDAARTTNNIDLSAKAERLAAQMDYVERIKQLPLDQQTALETELRRQLATGGDQYAGGEAVAKQLEARTEAIRKGLEENPIATAVKNFPEKFKTPAPLDMSDPKAFAVGLMQRAQIAQFAGHNWRQPTPAALDQADVDRIKQVMASPDLGVRTQMWGMLSNLPDDVRNPTFEKIAKGDPNARAEASAGAMMGTDPEVAKSIMAGLDIMRRDDHGILKAFEPKAGGAEGFDEDLIKFLPSTAYGSETRLNPEGNFATTAQMVKGRYAFLAAQSNTTDYSRPLLQQAVNDVTGGMVSLNGSQTLAPVRGMTQGGFDVLMGGLTNKDFAGVTDLSGRPVTADFVRGQGRLEAVGNGRYMINFADANSKPIYAYQNAGSQPQRFVLDLSGRPPVPPLGIISLGQAGT